MISLLYARKQDFWISVSSEKMVQLKNLLGETKYFSITYRLFKLKDLEPNCEDYGQYAIYLGSIAESPNSYLLDDHHKFEKNKVSLVCGNTASMLQDTWLQKHFKVFGDRSVHYGVFPCGKKIDESNTCNENSDNKGSCCS